MFILLDVTDEPWYIYWQTNKEMY